MQDKFLYSPFLHSRHKAASTIQKHLNALEALQPEFTEMYRVLGKEAVNIALRSGKITQKKAQELVKKFTTVETVH